MPVTSAKAAISARTTSAPAPGRAKMTMPNRIETNPQRIISTVSPPSIGSQKAPPTAMIPSATAYAPIT